jgi:hypothetical protein
MKEQQSLTQHFVCADPQPRTPGTVSSVATYQMRAPYRVRMRVLFFRLLSMRLELSARHQLPGGR